MQIIQTSGNKTFKVIPRKFVNTIVVTLTSESTGVSITRNPTAFTDGNYMTFTGSFGTLTEADFYTLQIKSGTDVIYKDKVFCTDQEINQTANDYYSINKNQFVSEDSASNEYIII
tara:strand:+ start:348 stop:695 length:348 start_codon:yes stop_codon:yes gene_type:complete